MDNNFNPNPQNQQNAQGSYTYYQNLYNMFGGYNPIIDRNANELRKLSIIGGCAVIGFTLMQYVFVFILQITGLFELYQNDVIFQLGIGSVAPLLYVFIPFFILFLIYKPENREKVMVFKKPKSNEMFVLAIFAGLMMCFAGNTVTSTLTGIFSAFGVSFTNPEIDMPSNAVGYILFAVECAVIPALVEEFALRGVVMQPLRKYGDWFAILTSSLIFAILHGNMVQIPFAFIAGIALGYFQITTGSIWTSVIIHFLNNMSSVVISIYYNNNPNASNFPYIVFSGAITVIGVVALIVYLKSNGIKLQKDTSDMGKSLKVSTYICTPPIVLAIIFSMYTSLFYAEVTSGFGIIILLAMLAVISFLIIRGIGLMRRDVRIKQKSIYTVSIVIMALATIIGTYMIVFSSYSSLANSYSY